MEFYLRIDSHLERVSAYVVKSCGDFDLVLGFGWRRTHQPHLDYRRGRISFLDPYCKATCWQSKYEPVVQCKGDYPKQQHPECETPSRATPVVETPGRNLVDIQHISLQAMRKMAKKSANVFAIITLQVADAHLRRAATGDDFDKYMDAPPEVRLQDILPPSLFKIYAECIPVFDKIAAATLAERSDLDLEIKLKPGAKIPNHRARPFSGTQLEAIQAYVEKMEAQGFIEKCNSPARNSLLIVGKPDGGIRVCADFRDLNDATVKDRYPIPFFRETLAKLNKATIFSKFDVIHAFHRIRMKAGSEWLTAFSTRQGTYQYKVMPFGLCNAPATFQRAINSALFDLLDDCCTAYLDDILVYSENETDHVQHVKTVLSRLKAKGFYVDPKKSEFHKTRVKFLGMMITDQGIEMDPAKVECIKDWTIPDNAKGLLGFLGYTGFYRRFIKGYSEIALPLTSMIRAQVKSGRPRKDGTIGKSHTVYETLQWNPDTMAAFQALKDAFRPGIVLMHFDPTKEIFIFTDASGWATGGVMKQRNAHGDLQPIAFFSKKHTAAECNYDIYDLELMGIVRAFEEWEPELIGSPHTIQVISDHKNLESFMTAKKLTRRQARWSLFLSQFDFKITYAPGSTNNEADALSRRPQDTPDDPDDPRYADHKVVLGPKVLSPGMGPAIQTALRTLSLPASEDPDTLSQEHAIVLRVMATNATRTVDQETAVEPLPPYEQDSRSTEEMLAEAYQEDEMAQRAFEFLDTHTLKLPRWFHQNGYFFNASDLSASGEGEQRRLFLDRTRLYIPKNSRLRRRILDLCHDHEIAGHKGPRATLYLMHNRYYWPKMAQFITQYCNACGVCRRTKSPREGKNGYLQSLPVPHSRWSDLTVDFIQDLPPSRMEGREYRNILVILDRLTKRRHFFPTHGRSAREAARCFMEVFKLHGLPLSITSDRGTNFVAPFWQQICKRLRIRRQLSTAYHPETDGQTERANQSLETFLRQYVNYAQDDWASWLHVAEFQSNDTVNKSIGMTPFFADLGYHPRSGIHPAENMDANDHSPAKDQAIRADEMLNSHSDLVEHLKEQLRWSQHEQSAQANARRHAVPLYKVGDSVWLSMTNWSTPRRSKKLDHRWAGPYKITRVVHFGKAYELELPEDMIRNGVFPVYHPNLLRSAADKAVPDQKPPQPLAVEITNESGETHTEWLVDEFLDCGKPKRGQLKGQWAYLVKWADFPKPSWHPASDYSDHYDAHLFHWRNPTKPKPPGYKLPANWQPMPEDAPNTAEEFSSGDESAQHC